MSTTVLDDTDTDTFAPVHQLYPEIRAEPQTPTNDNAAGEALLQRTLDYITEHTAQHDQGTYGAWRPDGSIVGCLAFHAVRLSGHPIDWVKSSRWLGGMEVVPRVITPRGKQPIHAVAKQALGLTADQAIALFLANNSIDRLWRLAGEFTDGRVAPSTRKAA